MIESNQIMIDLETWGRQPDGAIASIGAVCFNLNDGILDSFYKTIDVMDAVKSGGTIHPETMKWWLQQGDKARHELSRSNHTIKYVLTQFIGWYKSHNATRIWARNMIFDIPILNTALQNVELEPPYSYRDVRDVYGLEDCEWPEQVIQKIETIQAADGTWHNALYDATYQTEELLIRLKYLDILFNNGR